jgi:photosystem II stability/assembly factor-like uncharacterized protein
MKSIFTSILAGLLLICISLQVKAQSWEWLNGPYGGDIRALASNSSGHVFATTMQGNVLRSTDNGANWELLNVGNPFRNPVFSLSINQSSGYVFVGLSSGGIVRSNDNGNSWTQVFASNDAVNAIAINSSGHIFAGTATGGVYRSTDNGASWMQRNVGLASMYIASFAINSDSEIFTSAGATVYHSTDNGDTWALTGGYPSKTLAINNGSDIFSGGPAGVLRSTNDGISWGVVNSGLTCLYINTLAIDSSDYLFAGTDSGGIFRSTDNGNSWVPVNNGLTLKRIQAFTVTPSGNIFAGTCGGVFRSTDSGSNWVEVDNGFKSAEIRGLAVNAISHIFAGIRGGGVLRSTDNGISWLRVSNGVNPFVHTLAMTPSGYVYAGTDSGVYVSSNNGNNWSPVDNGLTNLEVYSLAYNSSGDMFAGTFGDGVFRYTAGGGYWTQINSGLTNLNISALAINMTTNHIFAGTSGGIFRSTDNGNSWTPMNSGLTNLYVACLAINSGGNIFAGTYGSGPLFQSIDDGVSWVPVTIGIGNRAVLSLAINSKGHIFAATSAGIFVSYDNGGTWGIFNSGLTDPAVSSLAMGPNDVVFTGNFGGYGVYRFVPDFVSGVDMAVSLWGTRARPGFQKTYSLLYENLGSQDAKNVNLSLTLTLPTGVEYSSCSPTPCGINGQTVSWNLGGVAAFTGAPASVILNVLPWASVGDVVSGTATISTTSKDLNAVNNRSDDVEQIVNSWDPNDKEVQPLGGGVAKYIMPSQSLRYTIFFENSPSATAEAINIEVVDTLDANLDWSTLEIGAMSHPDTCQAVFDNVSGVLTWRCDSIMLPPNHTPPEGEGFVTFSILPDSGLPAGTQIKNRAYIKFDFNPWMAAPAGGPVVRTIGKSGDANLDGQVTVSDVVFIVNYLFKGGSAPNPLEAADVNCDGKETVSDVVYLINYLFKGGPHPAC